jgi:hypothetical protein
MKYKIWYTYTFGRALYGEYFKSEFTMNDVLRIVDRLRNKGYKNVEVEECH